MQKIVGLPDYIQVTDSALLRHAGCPWKTATLRQYHYIGKYPDLFRKVGGKLMIKTEELVKILEGSN